MRAWPLSNETAPASGLECAEPELVAGALHERLRCAFQNERLFQGSADRSHTLVHGGKDSEVEAAPGALPREKAHHRTSLLVDGRADRAVAGCIRVRQRGDEREKPVNEDHDRRIEVRAVVLAEEKDAGWRGGAQYSVHEREADRVLVGALRERSFDEKECPLGAGEEGGGDRRCVEVEPLAAQVDRAVENRLELRVRDHGFDIFALGDEGDREYRPPPEIDVPLLPSGELRLLFDALAHGVTCHDGEAVGVSNQHRGHQLHGSRLSEPRPGEALFQPEEERPRSRRVTEVRGVDHRDRETPRSRRDRRCPCEREGRC